MAELFPVLELHEELMSPRVDRRTQSFLLKQVLRAEMNEVRQVFPRMKVEEQSHRQRLLT